LTGLQPAFRWPCAFLHRDQSDSLASVIGQSGNDRGVHFVGKPLIRLRNAPFQRGHPSRYPQLRPACTGGHGTEP
jgi:hypothetical protein